jgi:ankyrin repeat protein
MKSKVITVRKHVAACLLAGVMTMTSVTAEALSTLGGQTIGQTFKDDKAAALTKAAVAGDEKKVALLASQGVNVNTVAENGATPLVWALNARNHKGVEALLKAGADPNLLSEKTGMSPMNFVPMGDDVELLRLLLKYGGNPNHPGQGKIKERPLSLAASEGRIDNMKLLLDAGAEIDAHDQFNDSAANQTLGLANFEAAAFLLEHGYTFNLPYLAKGVKIVQVPPTSDAQRWKDKVLQMLKERGVEIK